MKVTYSKELPTRLPAAGRPLNGFTQTAMDAADKKPGYWAKVLSGETKEIYKKQTPLRTTLTKRGYRVAVRKEAEGVSAIFVMKGG